MVSLGEIIGTPRVEEGYMIKQSVHLGDIASQLLSQDHKFLLDYTYEEFKKFVELNLIPDLERLYREFFFPFINIAITNHRHRIEEERVELDRKRLLKTLEKNQLLRDENNDK